MPKYRVLAKSFINNTIVNEGDVVDYDGPPGSYLEPYEPARKARARPEPASETDVQPEVDAEVAAETFDEHLT